MTVQVNPYLSFGSGGNTVVDLTEPWGEAARVTTLTSGALVLSGYDFSGLICVQFHISGVTVTSDDTTVSLQFYIDNSLVTSGYRYGHNSRDSAATVGAQEGSTSIASIPLVDTRANRGVGNASTEGMSAVVTLYSPASSTQHKRCFTKSSYIIPAGNAAGIVYGGGQLNNSGAVTGIKVIGSSDLTGGSIIALGVE